MLPKQGSIYREELSKVYGVDLFCGAGGLTNGLKTAGIDVRIGVDIEPSCEYAYMTNNSADFLNKSVEDISSADFTNIFPSNGYRLIAGCAPCQTFSTYNRKATPEDKRWWLLEHFSRLVQDVSPELVTMENVPQLKEQTVFKSFKETLELIGYQVSCKIVNCEEYGVPQHRQRLVLLASKLAPIELLSPDELRVSRATPRDCISHLRPLQAGEVDTSDPLHQAATLSPTNLARIRASKPGGTWREWDKNLVAKCHLRATGQTYASVYGRMTWDDPAPTITTQFYGFGNGRFGHPDQDRAISLREGAILQSFPDDYRFVPPGQRVYKKTVAKLIGNAVPVKLGEAIGISIMRHVDTYRKTRSRKNTTKHPLHMV